MCRAKICRLLKAAGLESASWGASWVWPGLRPALRFMWDMHSVARVLSATLQAASMEAAAESLSWKHFCRLKLSRLVQKLWPPVRPQKGI